MKTSLAEQPALLAEPASRAPMELVPTPSAPVAQLAQAEAANDTPFAMALRAVERGMTPEMVERMLAVQERWEASEAKKAYFDAFASFRAQSVRVLRNVERTAGPLKGSFYADLAAVVDAVTIPLATHKLSHSWKVTKDAPDWIEVTCILSHARGYSESVSMGGPPDTGDGGKSPIQRRMSTVSMLERYTLKAITGVAEEDDDGTGGDRGSNGEQQRQPTGRKTPGTPPADAVPATAAEAAAAAAQGAPEGPFYPQTDFDKHFPDWEKAIKSGKQTPYRVISKLETVAQLSKEQKQKIRAIAAQAS